MLLAGKSAVVTGCSRGIGKAILELFAQHGAHVWACARAPSDGFAASTRELAQRAGVEIVPVYFDLTDEDQVKAGANTIIAARRPVDVLVNCAAMVSENRLFQMTPLAEMRKVFQVNFFAQMQLTQYISRLMTRQKQGSIVNISSIAGLDGDPAQLEYVASKAALIGATKKLALELGEHGIRVNAVAPGLTSTDMLSGMTEAVLQRTVERTILKRVAQPAEIAAAALFLASHLSSYVTGQVLRVDGGMKGT
jgi:3-oxoacyl-[acyl-carrier protein] reductase